MKTAVLGVVHLSRTFINLQRDSDRAFGKQGVHSRLEHVKQGVSHHLVDSSTAPQPHAQIGIEKAIVSLAISDRRMRRSIGKHARATKREDLFSVLVAHAAHRVCQGPAQASNIDIAFDVGRIQQDKMGHQ